jgi:N-acetylglutamate synthase-like GNAT family acetyltransferase
MSFFSGPYSEWTHADGGFVICDDPARLDLDVIHGFLSQSYWAQAIPRETVSRSIAGSLPFGVYAKAGGQVGFARVVTDCATFAYLADVFVCDPYRGRGISKWLMQVISAHPKLQGLRRWMLVTRDAQGLYAGCGFTALAKPERVMERVDPEIYMRARDREADR